ncbi:hypothetical protein A8D95_14905 [Burkholderia cenocepacia]|uniref:Uncharacterized protein n=1 Tax=Burkholderia cenocepacia TaxID=95486 RepID=A0A1V2X5L9_9BURK|nr:hypothetical protein A8E75_14840 [Burkholderia cenocepacia]AQQ45151.1 hypothetical protein A8F32_01820 [Burkholderia cenocepacia]ONJ05211.1 hypothetical protein A8D83_19680 [Burkholderia cenocepacia]ONJ15467.1 hypothetical protein A8F33_03640 [Burkholderia cenocepacia]ONJ31998.1 hypothetical protein A8F38_13720 [Burkholderia cenocepacia]
MRHVHRDRKILKIFPRHTKKLCSGNFGAERLQVRCQGLFPYGTRMRPRRHAGAGHQRCLWLTTLCGN